MLRGRLILPCGGRDYACASPVPDKPKGIPVVEEASWAAIDVPVVVPLLVDACLALSVDGGGGMTWAVPVYGP